MRPLFWALTLAALTACARPNYVTPSTAAVNTGGRKEVLTCDAHWAGTDLCLTIEWQVLPVETAFASFVFKFWRPNKGDGSALVVDPPDSAIDIVLWMPMGHGSAPVTVSKLDTGTFRAEHLSFFMTGNWEIHFQTAAHDAAVVLYDFH